VTDSVELALRNCNAALRNTSMQALFGRSFRNTGARSGAATEARHLALPAAIFAGIAQINSKSLQDFSGEFPTIQDDIHSSRRLGAVLIAGLIAIVVNTSMLEAPDLIPLVTALPALHALNRGGERLCS
jgi:hypothetical protein